MNTSNNVAIIILAAGASRRLGEPKQRLAWQGTTLLQHTVAVAQRAALGPVVVVLGANAQLLWADVADGSVHLVENSGWAEGMASSIRAGVQYVNATFSGAMAALLLTCDQPYVSAEILQNVVASYQQTGQPIITCAYAGTQGPPTLFDKRLFTALLTLEGDIGAKRLLRERSTEVVAVPFPEGEADVDTPADYQRLSTNPIVP